MKELFKLNCDLGEGMANDALLMPSLDACSIACGGHAGDDLSMQKTVELAVENGVSIGAHPSFPDRKNFGRVIVEIEKERLIESIFQQVYALHLVCRANGTKMTHIKPHGALYNLAASDKVYSQILLEALKDFEGILFLAPWNSVFFQLATEQKKPIKTEAFADRRYQPNLALVSRTEKGAVITDPKRALEQVLSIVKMEQVSTNTGEIKTLKAETFCVHGDNPAALEILQTIKSHQLEK